MVAHLHSVALQSLRPDITITDFDRKLTPGAMAPPQKKQKGHSVQELIRRLQAGELGKHPSATVIFDKKDWIFTFLKDIKPGAGTISTETEEKELYEAWIKELDNQGASDGEEKDAAAAGVSLAAEATPTSPGSLAGLTSGEEERLVAHTGKAQGEEYLENEGECEIGRDSVEVDGFYYPTSDYFGE